MQDPFYHKEKRKKKTRMLDADADGKERRTPENAHQNPRTDRAAVLYRSCLNHAGDFTGCEVRQSPGAGSP